MIDFQDYQRRTAITAVYPGAGDPSSFEGLSYVTLGLVGEAGEIANKVKKIARDKDGVIDIATRLELKKELGDCFWYLSQFATQLDVWLDQVAQENLDKLAKRKEAGTLQGSGDNR